MSLRIGELARTANVPVSTIRYYERIGLLRPTARSTAHYRLYHPRAAEELAFIQRSQGLGFTLPEIAGLLRLSRTGKAPCDEVLRLASKHLAAVESRIVQLTSFKSQLSKAITSWSDGQCGFTVQGLCSLIDVATLSSSTQQPKAKRRRRDA